MQGRLCSMGGSCRPCRCDMPTLAQSAQVLRGTASHCRSGAACTTNTVDDCVTGHVLDRYLIQSTYNGNGFGYMYFVNTCELYGKWRLKHKEAIEDEETEARKLKQNKLCIKRHAEGETIS